MSLGLCLDVGIVKDIAWCPSGEKSPHAPRAAGEMSETDQPFVGSFSDATGWEPEASGEPMARFGLLAVAAKSSVLVFAVPHPSALKGEGSVRVSPVSRLQPCQVCLRGGFCRWLQHQFHQPFCTFGLTLRPIIVLLRIAAAGWAAASHG